MHDVLSQGRDLVIAVVLKVLIETSHFGIHRVADS